MKITKDEVHQAFQYANQPPFLTMGEYEWHVTEHLNRSLEERFNRRWRRYGYILETLGLTSALVGVMLAITTEPGLGVIACTLGFIIGLIGHGMTGEK